MLARHDRNAMQTKINACLDTGADVFAADVSDDALERAAATIGGGGITMIYCTQDLSCGDV